MISSSFSASTPKIRKGNRPGGSGKLDRKTVSETQKFVNETNRIIREKSCEKYCAKEQIIMDHFRKIFETKTLIDKEELATLIANKQARINLENEIIRLKSIIARGEENVTEALSAHI